MDKIIRQLQIGILEGRIEDLETMKKMTNPKIKAQIERENIKKKYVRRDNNPVGAVIPDTEVR